MSKWTEDEMHSAYWPRKVYSAFIGALVMWVLMETLFVIAGAVWQESLTGFASYLLLISCLIALSPVIGYQAARSLGADNPGQCATWAAWPAVIMLMYTWAMSSVLKDYIVSHPDFGFAQFANTGAWTGAYTGLFGGVAYQKRRDYLKPSRDTWRRKLAYGILGAALAGACCAILGTALELVWSNLDLGENWYLYFLVFLILGTPFVCAALAKTLGSGEPAFVAVWSIIPTFLILFFILSGSAAIIDPSRSKDVYGKILPIGLWHGAASGLICGLAYRKRGRRRQKRALPDSSAT